MNLTLYNSTAEKNRIDKENYLTQINAVQGEPVDDFDVLYPVFTVLNPQTYYNSANYCYCTETARYYFIDKTRILSGNRLEISCTVDPLYTYKAALMLQRVTAVRSSNKFNRYVQDNEQPCSNAPLNQIKTFSSAPFNPQGLDTSSKAFVLALSKGGNTA